MYKVYICFVTEFSDTGKGWKYKTQQHNEFQIVHKNHLKKKKKQHTWGLKSKNIIGKNKTKQQQKQQNIKTINPALIAVMRDKTVLLLLFQILIISLKCGDFSGSPVVLIVLHGGFGLEVCVQKDTVLTNSSGSIRMC